MHTFCYVTTPHIHVSVYCLYAYSPVSSARSRIYNCLYRIHTLHVTQLPSIRCRTRVRASNAFYALRGCLGPTMGWATKPILTLAVLYRALHL